MRFGILLGVFIFCFLAFFVEGRGQEGNGFQEAKLLSAAKVAVPKEAKESGLGGKVIVRVAIDEAGKPTAVEGVSGPGSVCRQVTRADVVAIRIAATEAALLTTFVPAQRNGMPEASSSWITFDFPGNKKSSDNYFVAGNEESRPSKGTDGKKYTVKGDRNYSVANASPPDYTGPVNTIATGVSAKSASDADTKDAAKTISGGVLNGKAERLPKPPYPPAARAVRASGAVNIQVLIDENGEVFSAQAVSGHPLLRSASTIAACKAKFMPTLLQGSPVKVAGIITYNYVP